MARLLGSAPVMPLKDYNPTQRFAVVTVVLIAVNVVVYFLVQRPASNDQTEFSYTYAAIPCEVVTGRPLSVDEIERTLEPDTFGQTDPNACQRADQNPNDGSRPSPLAGKSVYLALLYSMFLHGSLLHIAGNMLYLWVFGNNIEDRFGIVGYIAFYLAAGLVATVAHVAVQPDSTVPVVGASGAIAGVMGAYLVLFPRVQIRTVLLVFLVLIRDIPAFWLLAFWFVSQFFTNPTEGVAWVAHVGGFVFGALVALLLRPRLRGAPTFHPSF